MPLRFPRNVHATAAWHTALLSENFGNPTVCTYDEMFAIMQAVRRWSLRSPTAQKLFEYLDKSNPVIYVIGMKSGGYTCFDSDCPTVGAGTCYVDVEANFKVASTGEDLHRYIAILHELGHAKQWVERPGWFTMMGRNTAQVSFKDLQQALIDRAMPKAAPVVASGGFGDGPPPPPTLSLGPSRATIGNQVRNRLGLQNFAQTHAKWPFIIEQDNMARHEWPICDEARYPRRAGYADLAVSYGPSPFTV
jgi:hypothetical protein